MFYVYDPDNDRFLQDDEKTWGEGILIAAAFTSREMAQVIADRQGGEGHALLVFGDGED